MKPALNTVAFPCPHCAVVLRTPGNVVQHQRASHPRLNSMPRVPTLADVPASFDSIICASCEQPMRVCRECLRQDWWYLYCQTPHCDRAQHTDYTHRQRHAEAVSTWTEDGERRYQWQRARRTEALRPNLRPDAPGKVRVRVFLIDGTRGRRGKGQLQLGNRQRTITVARGRVGDIADRIETALFAGAEP